MRKTAEPHIDNAANRQPHAKPRLRVSARGPQRAVRNTARRYRLAAVGRRDLARFVAG
jgi:hypothetical protein